MFRKLVLAASAAFALGAVATGFSAPAQARDFGRDTSGYSQDRGYDGEHRRWNDDEDAGYRRPHHGWRWGWRHRPAYFAYSPPTRPWWDAPRPRWGHQRPWFEDGYRNW